MAEANSTAVPTRRKSLSDKTRFEVFKRDSFKCQYCGRAASEVILEVDHVKPVAKGGKNQLLNYVTACRDCNAGKGARELSDQSEVEKQRRQIEDLNERRLQLEMMLRWREGLDSLEDEKVAFIVAKVNARLSEFDAVLNEHGVVDVRGWLRKFGFDSTLYGVQQASVATGPDARIKQMEQFAAAAAKVAREPQLRDFWRIRCRFRDRRFRYGAEWEPIQAMRRAFRRGVTVADMDAAAGEAEDYKHFLSLIGQD